MSETPKKSGERLRKRKSPKTRPRLAFSQSLREARQLIASDDSAAGLAALNTLAAATRNPVRRAKILLSIGESQTRHSRHNEAHAAFAKASLYANQAADTDLTLAAGTGMIRSLLRSLRSDEAKAAATQLLADLEAAGKQFADIQNLTPEQLADQGSITVPARPPRLTVGLTKIATAFMESGLTDEARSFLLKAIQLSPNGASRARQNLVPILEPDVFAAFQQHATGRIASASTLSIARVLRAHGDSSWKEIATTALAHRKGDKVITTEIEKLLHADAKLFATEEPHKTAARALRLIRAGKVSIQETVAHAKEYVRFSLLVGNKPNLERIVRIVGRKFPAVALLSIRHAACLGAMMATRHDTARQWLLALITEASQLGQIAAWGRANWALARMESLLENNAEAAFYYMEVAAHPDTPPRFKIQAMLRGLKFLGKSGDTSSDIGQLTENIRAILRETDDFRILLDAARQLALAGSNFTALKNEAADHGTRLADKAIAAATTPQEQITHLEYQARKLYWDLGRTRVLLQRWEALAEKQKAEYHATSGTTWYEYLSLVFLSLSETDRSVEATALASSILDHDTSSPEGYIILGTTYAEHLIRNGQKDKAFEYFTWIAKEAPTHRRAATSHYWLGIIFSDRTLRKGQLQKIKICLGDKPLLLDEIILFIKSSLFMNSEIEIIEHFSSIYDKNIIYNSIRSYDKDKTL